MPTIITFGQLASQAFGAMRRRLDRYFNNVVLLLTGRPVSGYSYIKDASTNNFALTVTGTVSPNRSNPFLGGYYSNYFSASGTGFTGTATGGLVASTVTTWTAECWVYMTQAPTAGAFPAVLGLDVSTGSTAYLSFYVNSSQNVGIFWYDGATKSCTTTSTVPLNQWTHIAVSVNSNTIQLYINGALQPLTGTTTLTNRNGSTNSFVIAYQSLTTAYQFYGYISNARIVSGTAVYTNNFIPPTSPLTAISGTTLLTCQSNRFVDNSVYNYALTLVGTPTVSTNTPFAVSNASGYYSAQFNGTSQYLNTTSSSSNYALGSGAYTVETWVYITGTSATYGFGVFGTYYTTLGWSLTLNMSTGGPIGVYWISGGAAQITTSAYVPSNVWVHIAVVRTSTATNGTVIYVNGTAVATGTDATNDTYVNNLYIGNQGPGSQYFPGYISNARFVKGTAVYTSNFTPPTSPLTAITNTQFLSCQNNTFIDNSTNAAAITNNGSATNSTIQPFGPPVLTPAVPTVDYSPQNQTTLVTNNAGYYSGYFDGSTGGLSSTSTILAIGTSSFTFECWVWSSNVSTELYPLLSAGGSNFRIFLYGAGIWYLNGSSSIIQNTACGIQANTWTHFALVRASGTSTFYVNGVSKATAADTVNFSGATTFSIGNESSSFMSGYISNLRFVVGTAVYTANFTPPTSPLTAITNTALLTCQNSTYIDNSTNSFTLTPTGKTQPSTYQPFTAVTTSTAVTPANYGAGLFGGSTNALTVANQPISTTANIFTVEAWIYPTATPTGTIPAVVGDNGSNYSNWSFGPTSSNTLQFYWYTTTGVTATGNTTILLNTWTHIAVSVNSGAISLYVNGIAQTITGTSTLSNRGTAGSTLAIGSFFSGSYAFTGYISNLRIVAGTALYTSSFIPPTAPLSPVTNTSLLTLQNKQSNNNNTFYDDSSNNFALTKTGTVAQGSFTPFAPAYSNYFDGSTGYLSSTSTLLAIGTSSFTFECWVWSPNVSAELYPLLTSGGGSWRFFLYGAGIWYLNGGSGSIIQSTTFGIQANTWTHIALVRASGASTIYVNGVSKATAADTNNFSGATTFSIGYEPGNGYMSGYISNLRFVVGTAVYTSNFTPPTSPLTAITNTALLTCQSNRFVDNSTNNFAITATGTVQVQAFNPFNPEYAYNPATNGSSLYFNGNGNYLYTANNIFNVSSGTLQWTFETWVYPTNTNTNFFAIGNGGTYGNSMSCGWSSNNFNFGQGTGSSNPVSVVSTSGTYYPYAWYHYAVSKDYLGNIRLFVNGTQVATQNYTSTVASGTTAVINGLYDNNGLGNSGGQWYLSGLRLVIGQTLYTSAFTPPTTPTIPLANTNLLLSGTNAGLTDFTGLNDAYAVGTVAPYTQPNTVKLVNGSNSGAVYFNGSNYLALPNSPAYAFYAGNFTVECWINLSAAGGGAVTLLSYNYQSTTPTGNWGFYLSGTGPYTLYFSSAATAHSSTTTATISTGTWYHVAYCRSGTSGYFFVNGTQVGTTVTDSTSYTTAVAGPMYVGVMSNTTNYLTGYMQEARVTNGVARYTANFTPPAAVFPVI